MAIHRQFQASMTTAIQEPSRTWSMVRITMKQSRHTGLTHLKGVDGVKTASKEEGAKVVLLPGDT